MKNIFIPTILQPDTVVAIKSALAHANGKPCTIILMQFQQISETFSAAATLRNMQSENTKSQLDVLELCRYIVESEPHCEMKLRTQYMLSSPLLNSLLDSLSIDLIIMSDSFKNSKSSSNSYCVKLLANCKLPILHVGQNTENPEFNNALYLEKDQSLLQIEDLQQLISQDFSCTIVGRATVFEDQDSYEIMPQLSETIFRNNIDLLIEVRKPAKIKIGLKEKASFGSTTGLPVLSLYEKIV